MRRNFANTSRRLELGLGFLLHSVRGNQRAAILEEVSQSSASVGQVVFDEAQLGHLRLFEPSHASNWHSLPKQTARAGVMLTTQVQLYHLRLHELLASEAGCRLM